MISMPSCSILRQPLLRKGGVDVVSCGRENVTYTMPGHGSFVVFLLFLVRGNGSLSPVTWRSNGVRRDLWPGVSSRVESPRGGGILHRVTVVEFHRSANEAIKWHDFHIDRDLSSNSLRKMSEYTCLQENKRNFWSRIIFKTYSNRRLRVNSRLKKITLGLNDTRVEKFAQFRDENSMKTKKFSHAFQPRQISILHRIQPTQSTGLFYDSSSGYLIIPLLVHQNALFKRHTYDPLMPP